MEPDWIRAEVVDDDKVPGFVGWATGRMVMPVTEKGNTGGTVGWREVGGVSCG